jgi:hypothetical protein
VTTFVTMLATPPAASLHPTPPTPSGIQRGSRKHQQLVMF